MSGDRPTGRGSPTEPPSQLHRCLNGHARDNGAVHCLTSYGGCMCHLDAELVSELNAAMISFSSATHLTGRLLRRRHGVIVCQLAPSSKSGRREPLGNCLVSRQLELRRLQYYLWSAVYAPGMLSPASQCQRFPAPQSQPASIVIRLVQPASPTSACALSLNFLTCTLPD